MMKYYTIIYGIKQEKLIGKILADKWGITEVLNGSTNNVPTLIDEADNAKIRELRQEIAKCNTTVEVGVVVDKAGLAQVEGLQQHLDELRKTGNISRLDINHVNDLIQTQNYNDMASRAHGFSGVKAIFDEHNRLVGELASNDKSVADKAAASITKLQKSVDATNPALGTLLNNNKEATVGFKSYGKSLAGATAKTIGLQAATMALNAVIGMGIGLLISGVIAGIDHLIHSEQKQKEKLEDAKSAYQEVASELKSVQDELAATGKRMDELQAKGSLTFVEQEEFDRLKKSNDELERRKELLDKDSKLKQDEVNQLFVKTMYKSVGKVSDAQAFLDGDNGYIKRKINEYNELREALSNAETELERQNIYDRMTEIESYFRDTIDDFEEISKGVDYIANPEKQYEKETNEFLSFIDDFYDKMLIVMGDDKSKINALNRILNKDEFADTKKQFEELGESGELTGTKVKELIENADGLYDKLVSLGVISKDDTDWFEGLANTFLQAQEDSDKAQSSMAAFGAAIEKIQEAYKTMQTAIKEYNKEGYISVDNYQSLLSLGSEYLQYLFDEEGNIRMDAQALQDLTIARIKEATVAQKSKLLDMAEQWNTEAEALQSLKGKLDNATASYEDLTQSRLNDLKAKWASDTDNWTTEGLEKVSNYLDKMFTGYDKLEDSAIKGITDGLGMTGESAVDTNKKLKDTQKQLSDLDKKFNADTIKHKFDAWNLSVEKLNNTMSLLDNTLDLISEDDHIGKIQTTTLQLDLAREKTGLLANEFTELQNTEYDSADAANELASRMKSVADEIADNQKNILEYGKNIAQYYGDALKAVGTLSKTQIDEASNLLDRNIKSLEEGGLIGLSFSLSPVATPQSAIEKQRQENKTLENEMKAHYDAVANMQKIALDMQYQETMADYARQREELVKSLNEIQTTLGNNSTEVQGIESDKNKKIAEAEKKSNQERLAEEKSFSDQSKGVINDLNNWMKNNPIVAPSLDTSAWEGLVTKAESYAQRVKDAFTGAGTVNALNVNKDSDISSLARGAFGNGRNALVEAARSQVGYKAGAGKYNKFSEFGVGYGYAYDSAEDWCNDFTSWAAVMSELDDVIPIGAGTIDTAERFKKNLKSAKNYTPKIGDIAYYGSSDSIGGIYHVEIVSGFDKNGKLITIGGNTSGGKVVERVRNDYPKFFGTYYNGSGNINADSIVSETHEPEYLVDKKTGELIRTETPTLFNREDYDVIGVEQTKKIDKHQYANGTVDPMDIAKYIRSHYPEVTDNAIAGILGNIEYESSFDQFNKTVEEYGGGNKGLIARRGLFQLDDTRIPNWSSIVDSGDWTKQVDTVLAEGRYQNSGMGNSKKHNMWQYLTDSSLSAADVAAKWDSLYERSDGKTRTQRMDKANEYLSQIKSLGLSMDANTSAMSTNVAAIAKADVITRIKDIIDSGGSNSSVAGKEGFEDGLVEFIENNLTAGEGATERLISAFEAMTQTDAEYKEQFKGLIQNLRDSAGTADYGNVRAQLSDSVANYTEAILGEQAKYQTIAIKETFDRAQEARQLALDYYNQRKADNASADELAILAQTISDLDTELQGYSDQYVSVMSSYTDYLVKGADREMRVYNERISWQDKVNDELQREVDHASSATEKMSAIDKLTDSYIKKQEILNEKMDAAHQSAEDLRHNAEFSPIFETFDTYTWFDADGNATAQFERDREALSLSSPELVPLLNRAFELLQKYTQEWQSANEETKQNADLIKDLELDKAQAKVEQYTKNLQRLNEIDDVRKSKQDAITSAMEKQHSLAQSLREETANINAELDISRRKQEWLDEDTRKLLFNDADYEAELKAINNIQAEASRLYKNYQRDLANLTETEWYKEVKITDEYNKQMDILNEKLNVSKQEIALKKKELKYNNALKERDTRIIIGGRSVQVANPDTMYNLAKERSLAQSELSNTLLTNRESEQERRSDRISQGINQEILAREKMVELLGKMDDAQVKAYANMLPVIDELEMFGNMLSDINIPWMNAHSRDYREQFADLPDIYKISGYNLGYDYAGGYDVVEDLYASGIISDEIMRAYSKQLESQHDLKRSTDINTAQYPDTYLYGGKHYADEYGIDDESRYQEQLLREQSREYSQLAYEINHGRGTQAQLDRIKELNDNNAKDNKYIANTLDTTLYTVNEDGIVVREGQKIGLDDDFMQQVGEIARGVVQTVVEAMPKEGSIAHGDYSVVKPKQKVGEIAHGDYSKYASGTKSAKAGLALTDEEGYELKLKQLGGKFRALDGGEMIFSNPQSANLFEFSQNPPNYIAEQIAKMNGQMASVVTNTDNRKSEVHNHYDIHDFDVNKPTDVDAFMGELLTKANGRADVTKNLSRYS